MIDSPAKKQIESEPQKPKLAVLGEEIRPDVARRLGLVGSDHIEIRFFELYGLEKAIEDVSNFKPDGVLNLLPRTSKYSDIRKSLRQNGALLFELNLGLYRRKLRTRLKALKLPAGSPGAETKNLGGPRITLLSEFFSKFKSPPDYLYAAAPRNLRLPAFARRAKILIESFFQEEMKNCCNAQQVSSNPYILFLDDAVSTSGDWRHRTGGSPLVPEVYAEEIQGALGKIARESGLHIIVAGHPGVRHENTERNIFGPFEVRYGETSGLIRNAKFVLTHQSSAIYQALFIEKPVGVVLTKSLEATFYGDLVASLARDAGVTILRPWKERFDFSKFELTNWQKMTQFQYLKNYIGLPDSRKDLLTSITELLTLELRLRASR